MKKYGLIGFPLSHSFSPGYFKKKFENLGIQNENEYHNYPLASTEDFDEFLKLDLSGFNITIPYKEEIIPFLDELSVEAEGIGAVNTVFITNGVKKGFNTDVYGFEESLRPLIKDRKDLKALILGTGGASKAVAFVFNKLNIEFQYVSRKEDYLNYTDLTDEIISYHHIIVNTTPLGMYPNADQCPDIPYAHLNRNHILYDLVYNPEKSLFLSKGEAKGAVIKNGLEMLHLQAEKAWDIWTKNE